VRAVDGDVGEQVEEAARAVDGVRLIVNELRIQPPPLTGM